ncbi:MAG: CheR family methyltransferase [Planctomycetota bacterium]
MELEQLNKDQLDKFGEFIYEQSGIRISDQKLLLLSNRIRHRLTAREDADFEAYHQYLISPEGYRELEHFLDDVTTNETFFFRTNSHFEWFKSEFLTEAVTAAHEGRRAQSLRIWSAGCATGAEPYTIAICLFENLNRLGDWSLAVFGSDINEEAIREARTGVFKARAVEAVSDEQRQKCFQAGPDGDHWQVRPDVRKLVRFEHHNLMRPCSQHPFDCIFIRNVLVYFDQESKQTAIENLIRALAPGGYLVVGPAEGIHDMLAPLERRSGFLYQKPSGSPPT